YFALSSAKTFAAGERASIQLSATKLDALDFRVYRVSDPQRFFESLEDPHMFGGRAPRPPHSLTAMERFHQLKREWHTRLLNSVRMQFSSESREAIRARTRKDVRIRNVTNYDEAPLLNSQQVVVVWSPKIEAHSRWEKDT